MPLDLYLASKLHLMENLNFHQMDEDMNSRMAEFYRDPEPWSPPVDVTVTEHSLPGPHGPVPYRAYQPSEATGSVLVWAHGGGFAAGNLDMLEAHMVSAELAHRAGAVVISVDYRLAQNNVLYPVPIDDVHAVAVAALKNDLDIGVAAENVAIGGASAGAALAMAAALRIRDNGPGSLSALLLAYPLAHFPNPGLAPDVSEKLSVLPASLRTPAGNVEWMVKNYVGRLTDIPADAIPGSAQLSGLPPTRIVVSEYDDLRSSAELLHRQLEESEVPVTSYLAEGMPHGHLNRGTSLPEVGRSLDFFAGALGG